jgi:hypothetical protein
LLQQEPFCYSKSVSLHWVGPLLLTRPEVGRVPKAIPGVYVLQALAPCVGAYAPFYVGKSHDLRRRLLEHLGDRSTKPIIRAAREIDRAYWSGAPVIDTALLPLVEAALIRVLRPVCNAHIPLARPVVVNLPPLFLLTALREEYSADDC